jgi:DNA polymerase-3 subunit alpha (Gram-positive type)
MLLDLEYVVFDLETTGLRVSEGDSIIEIGAVKLKNGSIIDRFDLLIKPPKEISSEITNITGITNDMVKDAVDEEIGIKKFMEWVGDLPMVAHNARFDLSFVEMAFLKYDMGRFNNTVIDTLGLSRYLESNERYHNLATLVIRYNIDWDEDKHHRADYDSEGTALILDKMLNKLDKNGIKTMDDLKRYRSIVIKNRVDR